MTAQKGVTRGVAYTTTRCPALENVVREAEWWTHSHGRERRKKASLPTSSDQWRLRRARIEEQQVSILERCAHAFSMLTCCVASAATFAATSRDFARKHDHARDGISSACCCRGSSPDGCDGAPVLSQPVGKKTAMTGCGGRLSRDCVTQHGAAAPAARRVRGTGTVEHGVALIAWRGVAPRRVLVSQHVY